MTILKRIMISITRRKAKSILLFFSVLILGSFVGASALVYQASSQMITEVEKGFDFYAYLSLADDFQFYNFDYQSYNQMQDTKYDLYQQLKELDGVEEANIQMGAVAHGMFHSNINYINNNYFVDFYNGSVRFLGIESQGYLHQQQLFEIVEGRNLTEEDTNSIVIHEKMVYEDGSPIQIGDHLKITYQNFNEMAQENGEYTYEIVETKDYEFEVVGRYLLNYEVEQELLEKDIHFNLDTLIPFNTLMNMRCEIMSLKSPVKNTELVFGFINTLFKFENYESSLSFVDSFNDIKGDNPFFTILSSDDGFGEIKDKFDSMVLISKLSLIISVLASILIGALTIILYLKDRKHETGILLAIGESKRNIKNQYIGEILIIGLIALVISIGTGFQIASLLFEKQFADSSFIQMESIDMSMHWTYYLLFFGGGVLVFVLTTIYSITEMMKKKIKELL